MPLLQVWPEAQVLPQPPQFLGSVSTLTQAPLHRFVPPPHAHVPLMHEAPEAHTLAHVPQLEGSVDRSVHTPLQFVCEPVQRQVPVTQR